MPTYLTGDIYEIARKIFEWAHTYLVGENPNIKRPTGSQAVCPFVATSLENNTFNLVFHAEVHGNDVEAIKNIMLNHITDFKNHPPFEPKKQIFKTLLVVFPNIHSDNLHVLDYVHQAIKPSFVKEHLMVGQFHEACLEPAIYNRSFHPSTAPYPLIAIRHMQKHDILFLGEDEQSFLIYNAKFGAEFKNPEKFEDVEKPLTKYYEDAKARFVG